MAEQKVRKMRAVDESFYHSDVHALADTPRVETGALQINDDWPGLFIRGDWCIDLYNRLEYAKNLLMDTKMPEDAKLEHALSLAGICGLQQMIVDDVLVKPKEPPKA